MPSIGNALIAEKGGFEPQRKNNWLLHITMMDTLMNGGVESFYLSLKSFPWPEEASTVKSIRWWNETRKYAGAVEDFGSQTLVIRDYLDQDVAFALAKWRHMVWDPASMSMGLAHYYKSHGTVELHRPDFNGFGPDNGELSRLIYIQGIWPSKFKMDDLDMDSDGEQVLVNIEFAIDRAYPGFHDGIPDDSSLTGLPLGTPVFA